MKKENVYILEDRGLLYVSGEDAKEFLQNIITNNIENVTDSKSCFAGLLTPQGKYLYDFIVTKHKSGYFLDCEKKFPYFFAYNHFVGSPGKLRANVHNFIETKGLTQEDKQVLKKKVYDILLEDLESNLCQN